MVECEEGEEWGECVEEEGSKDDYQVITNIILEESVASRV